MSHEMSVNLKIVTYDKVKIYFPLKNSLKVKGRAIEVNYQGNL